MDENFAAFEPIINKEWHGTARNEFNIQCSMEALLNGVGIRKRLEAPSLDFTSETTISWDLKTESLSFLRITSQGFILKGKITVNKNKIILDRFRTKTDSKTEFRNTLELVDPDTIIDFWYGNDGSIGHHIEYHVEE